jgi:integral membrane protein GPR137
MEEVDIKLSTLEPYSTRGFPTVKPALPADIYVPLSVIYIVLYGLVFIYVYFQLILIWYFRHKRFSYQTTLLFLSLVWSALRIVLFSFYFQNAVDANKLFFVFYFILYCLPVILQFITLCLLVLYYGQVD